MFACIVLLLHDLTARQNLSILVRLELSFPAFFRVSLLKHHFFFSFSCLDSDVLPVPQHVILNHLICASIRNDDVLVLAITERFIRVGDPTPRFITTIMYRPAGSSSPLLNSRDTAVSAASVHPHSAEQKIPWSRWMETLAFENDFSPARSLHSKFSLDSDGNTGPLSSPPHERAPLGIDLGAHLKEDHYF